MSPIVSIENLRKHALHIRKSEPSIILTGGCFDLLHAGHIDFLQKAKDLNGHLMILLESDESVRRLKGHNRPLTAQRDRAKILQHLRMVDTVVLLPSSMHDEDYSKLVFMIKPDIIAVTENDPLLTIKERQAKEVNGEIAIVLNRITGYSTESIIQKIKQL